MRALFFSLFLCFFFINLLNAQVSFGLKAGLSMASVNNFSQTIDGGEDLIFQNNWHPVFHGGVWTQIQLNSRLSLQPELLYSQSVWSMSGGVGHLGGRFRNNLHYLTLPIIFKYHHKNFSFGVGPNVSCLLYAENPVFKLLSADGYEIGLTGDVSWSVTERIALNLRYNQDLTGFLTVTLTDINGEPLRDQKLKNQAIQLGVSYSLVTKK